MRHTPLVQALRARIGAENVLSAPSELAVYDCDALTVERHRPEAVVLPRTTSHVVEVVRLCREHQAPIVPRGAGTSLAGGCVPVGGGVVVALTRMNRILEVSLRDRMALVEAGVPNLQLTRKLAGTGYHFAPDPSSQGASTIGGNVATNAGGPHTLKYGVTVNHVLGLEAVTADGSIVRVGPVENPAELDLLGLMVGGEGTLGIVTKVWVRLTRDPQDYRTMRAVFNSIDDACRTVSGIIAAGIIPAAMELMDRAIMTALEEAFHFGFPLDAGAILVIELDGPSVGLDAQRDRVVEFCQSSGAREVLHAATARERMLLWKCRKSAAGALGRLAPCYLTQDGVVPRTRLPEIIHRILDIGRKHRVRLVNVAHAGDGNVHPVMLFDPRDPDEIRRALAAGRELLEACIECGGSVTAEHGIGIEKIDLMEKLFGPEDLDAMRRVRESFDPVGRFNPGKVLPPKVAGTRRVPFAAEGDSPIFAACAAKIGTVPIAAKIGTVPTNASKYLPLTETVAPAGSAEVAEVVRRAARDGVPVYPIGGGAALDYGARPTEPGIGLSTAGLDRIVDHAANDMTITVEAGVTLARLAEQLASCRQRLPIDVAQPDRATVGGAVAVNPSGPRRFGFGTLRDYLLGIRAVDGEGREFRGGGRVVKNAAGYDLGKMLIGSLGTLAVVTEVTLMVRPMPETSALVCCDLPELQSAEPLLAAMIHTKTLPVAVELLLGGPSRTGTRESMTVRTPHAPRDVSLTRSVRSTSEPGSVRLVVGFEGGQPEVRWMVDQISSEWSEQGVTATAVVGPEHAAGAWAGRRTPLAPREGHSEDVARAWAGLMDAPDELQINVLPSRTVDMIGRLRAFDAECAVQAHAGNGVILARLAAQPPAEVMHYERLRAMAADLGGNMVVRRPPNGARLTARDVWGTPGEGAAVTTALKERFDPRHILNRGRYVFE